MQDVVHLEVMAMIGEVVAGKTISYIDAMPREDFCRITKKKSILASSLASAQIYTHTASLVNFDLTHSFQLPLLLSPNREVEP